HALGQRNLHLQADEFFRVVDGIRAFKMKDGLVLVQPAGTDRNAARLAMAIPEFNRRETREALRKVGEDFGGDFSNAAARAQDARQGDARGDRVVRGRHYSRISSVKRFFSFIPPAPRMVRM